MPDLASLELLVAVARSGSLGAAGRELGMTQQAASARVRSMETQTGIALVRRSPRGSTLTPNGELVAEWGAALLDAAHRLDTGLATIRGESRDHLAVAASQTIAEQLLPRWLVSWAAAATRHGASPPAVTLSATNSDGAVDAVRSGGADLGFVESPDVPSDLRSRVVAHDELTLVVSPAHPWAREGTAVDAAALARTPLVTREPGSGTRLFLDAALRAALGGDVVVHAPAAEMPTASGVRAAVLAGTAPAVISRLAVADDIAMRRLAVVPTIGLDLHRPLRAVWVGGATPPAGAARDLVEHIEGTDNPD
ncbi:LysR family transcriptional regulator [uncultured Williamsia sp.]|uniref:LysR family transcriptional regulator n=1 Tax=uncultured Williamsia sp. TaxID=259311 RepID=UPI00262C012A|nr:LysR family transcriptional regulator [uncultured Williamsia sp.]